MIAILTFDELSAFIAGHYNQNISFSQISEKEIKIALSKKIIIKNISIDIKIGIESVLKNSICISYSGGLGMDMIISGALIFLKNKLPEIAEGIINESGNHLKIDLVKIPQAKKAIENITLQDITILPEAIEVKAELK